MNTFSLFVFVRVLIKKKRKPEFGSEMYIKLFTSDRESITEQSNKTKNKTKVYLGEPVCLLGLLTASG